MDTPVAQSSRSFASTSLGGPRQGFAVIGAIFGSTLVGTVATIGYIEFQKVKKTSFEAGVKAGKAEAMEAAKPKERAIGLAGFVDILNEMVERGGGAGSPLAALFQAVGADGWRVQAFGA